MEGIFSHIMNLLRKRGTQKWKRGGKKTKKANRKRMEFPEQKGVDYSLLKTTEEGKYSLTQREEGKKILNRIIKLVGNPAELTITDANGGNGGDTILFGQHFKEVRSIEYNPENFEALQHNVSVYGLKNIRLYQGDSTQIYNWYTDILYTDPPWGGPDYKTKTDLELWMGDVKVEDWLRNVVTESWAPRWIFLKVPRNFHADRVFQLPNVKSTHKFAIRNYFLLALEVLR
jgi:predicted RNA methylase